MRTDPATFVALIALVLAVVLAVRLRMVRGQRRAYARRLAMATGHPSVPPQGNRPVRIMGQDGEYVAALGLFGVELRYETNAGVQILGRYPSDDAAIAAIAAHEAGQTS